MSFFFRSLFSSLSLARIDLAKVGMVRVDLARVGCSVFLMGILLASQHVSARPKIGLALGGGGAKGAAHIGVLRVLEQYKIPIDYIAGTSIGSVVGGMYASGLTVDEIQTIMLETSRAD